MTNDVDELVEDLQARARLECRYTHNGRSASYRHLDNHLCEKAATTIKQLQSRVQSLESALDLATDLPTPDEARGNLIKYLESELGDMRERCQKVDEENRKLQSRVHELEKSTDKCYWCGDTEADFYHVKCAQEMSKNNREEVSKVLTVYQSENTRLREALGKIITRTKERANPVTVFTQGSAYTPYEDNILAIAQQALSEQGNEYDE